MNESNEQLKAEFFIANKNGLHARPGAVLVNIAKKFKCNITITNLTNQGEPVNAKSLMRLMTCGIKYGHKVLITLDGSDAEYALAAISEGIKSGLGE